MSAAEWWCLAGFVTAGVAVVLSVVLALRLPSDVHTFAGKAVQALLGASLACLAAALWIALP